MWLPSIHYQVFYEALRAQFIALEYGGVLPEKARGIDTPTIWDLQDAQKRFISLLRFGGGASRDPRYFYRLHKNFKIGQVKGGVVNDLALSRAINYLGFKLTEVDGGGRTYPLVEEVSLLFNRFKIHYHLVDDASADPVVSSEPKDAPPLQLTQQDRNDISSPETMSPSKFDQVRSVIEDFFTNISQRRFRQAWITLSPTIRARVYQDDFSKFKKAYYNTRAIRYLTITDLLESSSTKVDCTLSYEDEIDAYTSPDLDSFNSMTVKNVEQFTAALRRLEQEVIHFGGEGFDKIELSKFFEPAASETIWYSCNIDPEKLPYLFSRKRTVRIKRNYSCSCDLIDGRWLIERITTIPIASLK